MSEAKVYKLTFRQEAAEMVVTTEVTCNGSPHEILTRVQRDEARGEIVLQFDLIHSRDRLVRSISIAHPEWHLPEPLPPEFHYRVEKTVLEPSAQERQALVARVGPERSWTRVEGRPAAVWLSQIREGLERGHKPRR